MKAFVSTVCLIVLVALANGAPSRTGADGPVNCDISVGPNGWAVLLPNPRDCGSYYACDAGVAIPMPCPDGLHFNPKYSVCDWPANANCTAD